MTEYGYEISEHQLDGKTVYFADWLHPSCGKVSFSQDHLEFIKQIVKPGATIIDVGAHTGFQTVLYGLAAGPNGLVFVFEPNPYVCKPLSVTLNSNLKNFDYVLFKRALSSKSGPATFMYSDRDFCNGGKRPCYEVGHTTPLEVECMTATEAFGPELVNLDRVDFIKIDTEGSDLDVLSELKLAILKFRPIVQSELFIGYAPHEYDQHIAFFYDLGYKTFFMPEDYQRAIGNTPLKKILKNEDELIPGDLDRLRKIARGEDILSFPCEML